MEDNREIKDIIKACKMKLLFTQTRYLNETYNKKNLLLIEDFYLVDKKWLDDYKKENNYDKIVEELKNPQEYNDYSDVKDKLLEESGIDNNDLLTTIGEENITGNFFSTKKQKFEKYEKKVPKNMEIVSKNFIHDCFGFSLEKKLDKQTEYLGDQTILI